MTDTKMIVKSYLPEYEQAVIELWRKCNLLRPWNNAKSDIERKLKVNPELFLVGFFYDRIVATAVGGYEGHRGWINYLAVDPVYQEKGLGKQIVETIERKIRALGCPKINIQLRIDNQDAINFYESIGYNVDKVISMGKRLEDD
ncbi:GNAT family acetyltransferase [Chloroflexota bacterium]